MAPESGVLQGVSRKPGLGIEALTLHAGLCRGGPNNSLANRGNKNGVSKIEQKYV